MRALHPLLLVALPVALSSCGSTAHPDAPPPRTGRSEAAELTAAPSESVTAASCDGDELQEEPTAPRAADAAGLRELAEALEATVNAALEGYSPPLPLPTARALDDRVEVVHGVAGQLPTTPVDSLGVWLRMALTYDVGAPAPERCWDLMGSEGNAGFELVFGLLIDDEGLWLSSVDRGARRVDLECVEPAPGLLRRASLALHERLADVLSGGGSSSLALPSNHPLTGIVHVEPVAPWAEWDSRLSAHTGAPPVTQRFLSAAVVLQDASEQVWVAALTFDVARHLPESELARLGSARWVLGVTPLVYVAPATR